MADACDVEDRTVEDVRETDERFLDAACEFLSLFDQVSSRVVSLKAAPRLRGVDHRPDQGRGLMRMTLGLRTTLAQVRPEQLKTSGLDRLPAPPVVLGSAPMLGLVEGHVLGCLSGDNIEHGGDQLVLAPNQILLARIGFRGRQRLAVLRLDRVIELPVVRLVVLNPSVRCDRWLLP